MKLPKDDGPCEMVPDGVEHLAIVEPRLKNLPMSKPGSRGTRPAVKDEILVSACPNSRQRLLTLATHIILEK